jgi:hypothetical protein
MSDTRRLHSESQGARQIPELKRHICTMRELTKASAPLSEGEIKCFLGCHIPYRLEYLRRAAALASSPAVRDPALVEAALMAGRQLIQFLGFRLKFSGGGRPSFSDEKSEDYHPYEKDGVSYTDEVKIKNLGVECLKLSDLKNGEDDTLAEFLHGANKSTAHLTEGSGHRLNHEGGEVFYEGCEIITRLVKAACSVAESKLPS